MLSDAAGAPFSIAVVSDTQNYVSHRNQREGGFPFDTREMLYDMMAYLARNARSAGGEIAFVSGLGDNWQHPSIAEPDQLSLDRGMRAIGNPVIEDLLPASPEQLLSIEMPAARAAWNIIADRLPFCVIPGNHDYDHLWTDHEFPAEIGGGIKGNKVEGIGGLQVSGLANWTNIFGASSPFFDGKAWYVSFHDEGCSSAQIFSAGGYRFLHLGLEMCPNEETLAWADGVINAYPGLPTIVSIHEFLNEEGERASIVYLDMTLRDSRRFGPARLWERFISRHDQILMTLNGHFHGVRHRIDLNQHGHKVYQFLVNYQGRKQSLKDTGSSARVIDGIGDGWLRLLRFDLAAAMPTLYLRAYSTHYKGFAPDLPRYAEWYGKEHPGMPAEEFLRLDDIAFDLEDFRQRFGPPGAAADP
ncbi:serine/threonine protein phosphatase [Sphingomonas sp. NPDC085925]|uniref:serine/threonine protein phosphatase n=1 Tax=unclassified Sphingomonas TaxID=196159 RepID=UPI003CFE5ECB